MMMVSSIELNHTDILDETENKKTSNVYKRKKVSHSQGGSKKEQLTKKNLEQFNNATTRDYLSDDGEEALEGLFNIC